MEAIRNTVELRYIDWLITTPLLLIEFGIIVALAGAAKKGLITRIVIADLIMIVTGYLGETSEPGAPGTVVLFVISSLAWFSIIYEIFRIDISNGPAHAQRAVKIMRLFVVIGWAIYPIATAIEQFLQIGGADVALAVSIAACIYVVADVVNKVGFGIVAIQAAKVSSGINEVAPSAVDGK